LIVTHTFLYYPAWYGRERKRERGRGRKGEGRREKERERECVLLCYTSFHAIFTVPRVRASNSPRVAGLSFTSTSSESIFINTFHKLRWCQFQSNDDVNICMTNCIRQMYGTISGFTGARMQLRKSSQVVTVNICKVFYTPLTDVNIFGSVTI